MSSSVIDLRSDTLSQPTADMRRAMLNAPVGDAFYDEDPSVLGLEEKVATLFGHEAALFMPSGTMSNQIAIQLHCQPGEAVLAASDLHILRAESGAISALAGVQPVAVPVEQQFMPDLNLLTELVVGPESIVTPPTRLLVVENTHLFSGGRIHPIAHLRALSEWCKHHKIAFHLDGARIWHAHVATGTALAEYGCLFDTLSVCFSKGLGAPVGSCLIAPRQRIQRAKLIRKRMGGTMRQCGILAAGADFALENHLQGLREDHVKAQKLAGWLQSKYPQASVATPETNIVLMKFNQPAQQVLHELREQHGLQLSALNSKTLRAVCYRDIPLAAIEHVIRS